MPGQGSRPRTGWAVLVSGKWSLNRPPVGGVKSPFPLHGAKAVTLSIEMGVGVAAKEQRIQMIVAAA